MTGIDCLKEELKRRGFTAQQTESKIVLGVVEALSGAEKGVLSDPNTEVMNLRKEIARLISEKESLSFTIRNMQNTMHRELELAQAEYAKMQKYIDDFYKAVSECETPEGRDKLRAAQMFVNSVDLKSGYDNTAFIIALGAIISGGEIAPIEELEKINKKLPWQQKAQKIFSF